MFGSLYCTMRRIGAGLGLLTIAGGYLNAQQWENVGGTSIISTGGSGFNHLVIGTAGKYYLSYYDQSESKGSVQMFNNGTWSYLGGTAGVTEEYANHNSLSVAPDGSVYHLSKGDNMDVNKFTGTIWSALPSIPTSGFAGYPSSVTSSDNILYTYVQGTVRRFVNGAWQQVGANVVSDVTYHSKIKLGNNGKVYVCQISNGGVRVYENTLTASSTDAWTLVGGTSLGTSFIESVYATVDFTIGTDNSLYVVYGKTLDNPNDPNSLLRKINVKKFNGTSWVQLGDENFGAGENNLSFSIAVTPQGKPFVAASSWYDNDGKNTVYELNSTSNIWTPFGGNFVSDGVTYYNDLAFDTNSNSLVLTYSLEDSGQGAPEGAVVKKFTLENQTPTCNNTDPGNNPGDLGCVTFTYNGQPVTYTTVRGSDGKVWLQQNLGSTKVAESLSDADSYGDLFQWGRWDDGHQLRNSPTSAATVPNSPNGLSGTNKYIIGSNTDSWWASNATSDAWTATSSSAISSTVGADPCKAIGQGWRLPTSAEWVAIASNYSITSPATAYASHLKLPAGGYRSNTTGGFTFVGQRGYYWSSETAVSGGKYLYIGGVVTPTSGGPRGQGESVRCTKDATIGLGTSDLNIKNTALSLYPNPTNGILNIKTDSAIEIVNVTNVVGQKINVQFSDRQINMQGLPNGVYIVELKLKNGQSFSKKVVKN